MLPGPESGAEASSGTGCGRDARAPRQIQIISPWRGSRRSRAGRRRLMRWGEAATLLRIDIFSIMNIDRQDRQDEQDERLLHEKLARRMILCGFTDAQDYRTPDSPRPSSIACRSTQVIPVNYEAGEAPTGSTAGCALVLPTPPQGGSDWGVQTGNVFLPLGGNLFPLSVFLRGPSRTPFESFPTPWSPFVDPLSELWRIPLGPPPTP